MKNNISLTMEVRMNRVLTIIRGKILSNHFFKKMLVIFLTLASLQATLFAQEVQRTQPTWWYGVAGAANLNFYGGTTQMLNSGLTTPSAFHKGFGVGLYLGPVMEYRPDSVWGGMFQLGYDDRRASFNDVPCPCGENSTLSSTLSYLSFEPSLRFAPFKDNFYIFGGPRIAFNFSFSGPDEKTFLFTQAGKSATKSQFSDMHGMVISGQIGIGNDYALTSPEDETQVNISPYISYQPFFGQDPRSVESWGVSTVRLGIALKFGRGEVTHQKEKASTVISPVVIPQVAEREVQFSVRAPKAVPVKRRVRETFPIRNYVFFEEGSTVIPDRYEMLTKEQAAGFKEEQLQEVQPKSMSGRSLRQMAVYYNIMNILGDRLRRNPKTTISLSGASENGPAHGKERAESIKRYLVTVFGIDSSRITTEGRDKPRIPSEIPGGTKELALLRAGDRRVDIESTSPELMLQVGGPDLMLKPVQIVAVVEDPLDGQVLFDVVGAKEAFTSWSLEITDEQGKTQRFGPSTKEEENISGNAILGDRAKGDYKIVMIGQTKSGKTVRKESTVHLIRRDDPAKGKEAVRFSVLFDFDKSKSVASYEKFLIENVVPLIPDSGVVVIHGYTDIIGEEEYNENLSRERVQDTRTIIERAILKSGKRGITFETFGFGEDLQYSPFDNYFPEGRFYNRSVIIDIVP